MKIHPTTKQKKKLNKWINAYKFTYNKIVEKFAETKTFKKTQYAKEILNKDSKTVKDNDWLKDTPYDVKYEALRELKIIITENMKRVKQNKIKKFNLSFKTKRDRNSTITIQKKYYTTKRGMYSFIKNIKGLEDYKNMEYAFKITRNNLNEYYITIPRKFVSHDIKKHKNIISLDPGIKTFLTGYDIKGNAIKLNTNENNGRLYKIKQYINKLNSDLSKASKHKTKYNIRKMIKKLYKKIDNLRKDMHHKIAKFLCKRYKIIILPEFGTKQMISKEKRLSKQNKDKMVLNSHYTFRRRLMDKAKEYNTDVLITKEHYTSKTCSNCGSINYKFKIGDEYRCKKCKSIFDRDINAAKNILIKTLVSNDANRLPSTE